MNKKIVTGSVVVALSLISGCAVLQKVKDRWADRSSGAPKGHRGDVQRPGGKPVIAMPAGSATESAGGAPAMDEPVRSAAEVVPAAETCIPLLWGSDKDGQPDATLPQASRSGKYVVTKLFRPCVTRRGQPGIEVNSTWLAMGFPCSGGDGRVDWKGTNYQRPKLVELIVANDCPMGPSDSGALKEVAAADMGMPRTATLGAYTPFMVQFWEIPSLRDADTGFTVTLRGNEGLTTTWSKMTQGEPLRVKLIGRENAWTQTDHIYSVDADLIVTSRNRFQLRVITVKVMTSDDIKEARTRCGMLRPARNCASIF